ncbi:hypothetical protein GCM10009754_31440 [Amycolatopsis minnesotensis]|uniref:Uncharacterized protein n=1 Tax=Amycolatopsis minnesotensis TaxID=337894 RepID=A0ABN2QVN1_9PSEU
MELQGHYAEAGETSPILCGMASALARLNYLLERKKAPPANGLDPHDLLASDHIRTVTVGDLKIETRR